MRGATLVDSMFIEKNKDKKKGVGMMKPRHTMLWSPWLSKRVLQVFVNNVCK